ncbi:MAG: AAA family ATPase [Candidatus Diapherotrites archaeon]
MPQNLFARAGKKDKLVFRDERFLYPEFVPERLPFRDSEIDSLVFALNPVTKGGKPQNVFVCGPTGVGKTVAVKFVLKQLEEFSDRAKASYFNCFEFNSRHSILSGIANLLGAAVPRRGIATDEIYTKMVELLKKSSFTPIAVLDEADQLPREELSSLLYDLLRVTEQQKNRIGVVLVSNDEAFTAKLDARVKSSLSPETISFSSYSPQQLKQILAERCEFAFQKNALAADVVSVAAAHSAKLGGDARIAIESLLRAGREAEKENSQTVQLKHLHKAFESVDSASSLKSLKFLSEEEKLLLSIVASKHSIDSGEIYSLYKKKAKSPLSERRLRDLMNGIEQKRLVKSELLDLGNKGKTKRFSCCVEKAQIDASV